MKITLVTVGKIKESYLADAIEEYKKRLGRYCKLEILQVADEKTRIMPVLYWRSRLRIKKGNESWP